MPDVSKDVVSTTEDEDCSNPAAQRRLSNNLDPLDPLFFTVVLLFR